MRVIGYANRAEKEEVFHAAEADVVVTTMKDIAAVLIGRAPERE